MQVDAYLVDWDELVRRHDRGTLADDVFDALESGAQWIESVDLKTDSEGWGYAVAKAVEAVENKLPADLRKAYKNSFGRFISFEDGINDLDDENAEFAFTLSPATAHRMAALAATIDYQVFAKSFYAAASDVDKQTLAEVSEFGEEDIEQCFEGGVVPYLKMWHEVLDAAAQKKRGLLIDHS